MPTYYADYNDFTAQYSIFGVSEADINSDYLFYGWNKVNISLGKCFTTPFSSNNITAKLLNVMFGYYKHTLRTEFQDDSTEIKAELDGMVEQICSGNAPMVLDDGTALFSDINQLHQAWSNNMDYKPTFDMRDVEDQRIDPDRIEDLQDEDY